MTLPTQFRYVPTTNMVALKIDEDRELVAFGPRKTVEKILLRRAARRRKDAIVS